MSGYARNAASKGNTTARSYIAPTPERRMEKKMAALEKSSVLMTEKPVVGLATRVNEKELGKGAMILHIGQENGFTAQLAIHRPIGSVPDALATDWALTPKAQLDTLLKQKNNPFEEKTQQRVTQLKVEYGLQAGLLKRNTAGEICYPDDSVREKVLAEARVLHDIHASVEGGKPMKPIFSYAPNAYAKAEVAYLNLLANSEELKVAIDTETSSYREHETKDPVTGQKQVTMKWAQGIPAEQMPTVFMEVIQSGGYDAAKWDKVKEMPPKKASPFAVWKYSEGDIPPDKLADLTKKLREYATLRKEYNLSVPKGQKAEKEETAEAKQQRLSRHEVLQKAAHSVNQAERFTFTPYKPVASGDRNVRISKQK